MEGFIVEPPSTTSTPSSLNSRFTPSPLATATTAHVVCSVSVSAASRALRSATCSCMSATSKRDTSHVESNSATAAVGIVRVHVHAQGAVVAHHEHRVTELLEQRREVSGVETLTRDGEVRAVAEARRLVLGAVERRRRVLVLELRRVQAAQPRQASRDDHGEPVGAGVDHSGLAQDRELLGPALHGLLAGFERVLEHLGKQLVLLRGGGLRAEPLSVHVREVVRHAAGHRAHRGEHRALGRVAHRRVGGVGGSRQRGRHQHRVHELARPGRQLLGGAANDLREDHAAVAARAEQSGASHGAHDLVTAHVVDRRAVESVQLVDHRAHRQRHVVPRVTVGDREDVQVVDLLAAVLQLVER